MIVRVVERPLLEVVMKQADDNQSRAAEWLGLNRNTLRKKLVEHKLLK
jgi:Fis family transcriptional regulator